MVNANRDMLLGNLQLKVEDKRSKRTHRGGRELSLRRHLVQFFPEQEELFAEAVRRRFGRDVHGPAEYARLAVLAFVAYDLDLEEDFLELATLKELPESPAAAEQAQLASSYKRGLWGILGLGFNQRGKK